VIFIKSYQRSRRLFGLDLIVQHNQIAHKEYVVPTDIDIAQAATMEPITKVAASLGISDEHLEAYGRFKAKISLDYLSSLPENPGSKLILVTAITPTPAGEGKTTTTVGLGDALNKIGKRTMICLREPSLGPVFGMKGGAAGGGYAQVVPMEDINLHFTGDFGAIGLAHNLLSALIDNHIHHGNELRIDTERISWKRVVDMNDRALRKVEIGIGGKANGPERSDGYDIVVASEIMAIFCLATSLEDVKRRINNIVIGYNVDGDPVLAKDLKAAGAMTVLLKNALAPNLVQTLENTPAIVHGGPFANIAHGCNSVIATTTGMKLADYVVTEAGFGADLGAEKFIDIKCRKSGLRPNAVVLVATIRALKYHGGFDVKASTDEDLVALETGLVNLERHVANIKDVYGMPVVVAINKFSSDTDAEVELLRSKMAALGVNIVLANHWAEGGAGAIELANKVVELCEGSSTMTFTYPETATLWQKLETIAKRVYGASGIDASEEVKARFAELQAAGYGEFPVCVAKTQYSFSTDAKLRGAPSGHVITVRELRLSAGAEFVVAICGDVMTMPGLPKVPAAERIDLVDGKVVGLF